MMKILLVVALMAVAFFAGYYARDLGTIARPGGLAAIVGSSGTTKTFGECVTRLTQQGLSRDLTRTRCIADNEKPLAINLVGQAGYDPYGAFEGKFQNSSEYVITRYDIDIKSPNEPSLSEHLSFVNQWIEPNATGSINIAHAGPQPWQLKHPPITPFQWSINNIYGIKVTF